jgi:alkanesulfonate monooxygenase SsuD/methylene tetrahydromethanopterin reductase-like flavin-dependent oxidoreductase (luciferase family)
MKLGVHLGYWGLGMGADGLFASLQEAERLVYDSVWTAEAYGSNAATVLALLAARTTEEQLPVIAELGAA